MIIIEKIKKIFCDVNKKWKSKVSKKKCPS